MISLIKKYTACRLVVGQNGRIWIDGDPDDILIAMGAINMIADQAHVHGLTNNVKEFLQKAKGIDPEKEAEEERKAAEEAKRIAEERAEKARLQKQEQEEKRRKKAEERKIAEQEKAKKEKAAKQKAAKEEEEDFDEEYDSISDDDLCRDPDAKGTGIVTVLAPDGESLMVVDEEELPPCDPADKDDNKKKEGQ
jgi:exosome complex component RRP4